MGLPGSASYCNQVLLEGSAFAQLRKPGMQTVFFSIPFGILNGKEHSTLNLFSVSQCRSLRMQWMGMRAHAHMNTRAHAIEHARSQPHHLCSLWPQIIEIN